MFKPDSQHITWERRTRKETTVSGSGQARRVMSQCWLAVDTFTGICTEDRCSSRTKEKRRKQQDDSQQREKKKKKEKKEKNNNRNNNFIENNNNDDENKSSKWLLQTYMWGCIFRNSFEQVVLSFHNLQIIFTKFFVPHVHIRWRHDCLSQRNLCF